MVRQYNATEHETVHDAPKEIASNEIAKFMVLQDNAQKMQHNNAVLKVRKNALEETKAFRRPLGTNIGPFRRGFKATFGDVEKVKEIKGSTVIPEGEGEKLDIKRVMPVNEESGNPQATFAQGDARTQRKREIIFPITIELFNWLDDEERSISSAAAHLKKVLSEDEYWRLLRSAGFQHLSGAIHITPELTQTQGGFFVKRS